jgi:hypothetical protein
MKKKYETKAVISTTWRYRHGCQSQDTAQMDEKQQR